MKTLFLLAAIVLCSSVDAQSLKDLVKKKNTDTTKTTTEKKSGIGKVLSSLPGKTGSSLTNDEIIAGLKEALNKGSEIGTKRVSAVDGFFKDQAIKVLMPESAKKVEKTLRSAGMGKLVDNAILSMNRAAEDAAIKAAPIFGSAIKGMSFQDALGILRGNDSAATSYLRNKTTTELTKAFRPVIEASLEKVNATKHWNAVITSYNKISLGEKINPDLAAYVTEKALAGIFLQLAIEEAKIRKDPLARTSDILKKVFAK